MTAKTQGWGSRHIVHQPTQMPMNFGEMVIDNFAGGGGASTGIEFAIGRPVDIAINHDPEALAMHAINHPRTMHLCESVWDVNPLEVTRGCPVGLVHLSPDCKHHSRANGDYHPDPKRKGKTFQSFCNALRNLGYQVEYWNLRACDYGAPTIRKRLFLVARNDGLPITKPQPTHGDPNSDSVQRGSLLPWKTAADCIDWSIPCPLIFERKRPLADATCRRIARGIMRYVVNADSPFIVKIGHTNTQSGCQHRSQSLSRPVSTITSKNEHMLVQPFICRQFGQSVGSPVDAPIGTVTSGGMGKSALCAAFLAKHYTGVVGAPLNGPVHTVTAQDHHSLVTSNMVKLRGTNTGSKTEEPMHTISAGGTHHAEVRSFLVKYYGNEKEGCDLNAPIHTATARDRFGLVTIAGEEYQIVDIGMRMLQPRELFRAQGFPDNYIIGDDARQGLKLTKSAQVRMCGNSVCPHVEAALISANYELIQQRMFA